MGKISPVSAKYIVHSTINIDGVVDKPDVIGAVFGQTEGLLGSELELRELQRSGRIGRIEVNLDTHSGKTQGVITIPSSLDKAETAIIGAALEIIQRIGPCNARLHVEKIEDVRISKRTYVVERAKELLKNLIDNSLPDSQEIADEVMRSVRVMEIQEYGKDRLPAGPAIDDGDEIIIVEGRADVLNMLRHGIKNAISMNGTNVPPSIAELSKKKIVTAYVDGDRGGDLIIRALLQVADIDYVTKAPDGKEVEELAKKEIHQGLRARVVPQQMKLSSASSTRRPQVSRRPQPARPAPSRPQQQTRQDRPAPQAVVMSEQEKTAFKGMADELLGTRAAYVLDNKLNILGKVPVTELPMTLKGVSNVHAIVFDGVADREIIKVCEAAGVKLVIAMDNQTQPNETQVKVMAAAEI